MYGQLGMISGYQIFEQNLLTKMIFVKKQKRKLKNRRWVKNIKRNIPEKFR